MSAEIERLAHGLLHFYSIEPGSERSTLLTQASAAMLAEKKRADEAEAALSNLQTRAAAFWEFLQGEYGVKLSSEDHDDHNVYEFFAALAAAGKEGK